MNDDEPHTTTLLRVCFATGRKQSNSRASPEFSHAQDGELRRMQHATSLHFRTGEFEFVGCSLATSKLGPSVARCRYAGAQLKLVAVERTKQLQDWQQEPTETPAGGPVLCNTLNLIDCNILGLVLANLLFVFLWILASSWLAGGWLRATVPVARGLCLPIVPPRLLLVCNSAH